MSGRFACRKHHSVNSNQPSLLQHPSSCRLSLDLYLFHTIGESQKLKTKCPFCEAPFTALGKHLRHGIRRDGRSYEMFLSQSTIRKPSKSKGSSRVNQHCPKCLKMFQRFDLHLRRSATYLPQAQAGKMKLANLSLQQQHSGQTCNTQPMSSANQYYSLTPSRCQIYQVITLHPYRH